MGVSGSGKTTVGSQLAESLDWPFFEGDDLHPQSNIQKMANGVPLTDADRWPWLAKLRALIGSRVEAGGSGVLAASVLKRAYRQALDWEGVVSYVYLRGTPSLIRGRLEGRQGHFMGADLLPSQFAALEPPKDGIAVDIDAPVDEIVASILSELRQRGVLTGS